jgi:hypothetical protein
MSHKTFSHEQEQSMLRQLWGLLFAVASALVLPGGGAAQPVIAGSGILNGASYAVPGLPNSGIAQGSIFIVFGQNLGPATIVQVSRFPLPTSNGLAGTSIKVTVGGTTVDAIMLYTLASQVAAVSPDLCRRVLSRWMLEKYPQALLLGPTILLLIQKV